MSFSGAKFRRLLGVSKSEYELVRELVLEYCSKHWSNRGKPSDFTLEDRLLLTLRYLRDYPTFLSLGAEFKISESWAQKIFTSLSHVLVKVLALPNLHVLEEQGITLEHVVIDVTEQPSERSQKNNAGTTAGNKKDTLRNV